ncbi:ADP-ribosylation factor 4-like [Cochliomyia hominivorax]
MGLLISRLFDNFMGKENVRIVMLGLDGAGKTTILYKLKLGDVVCTIPTIGFNVETVEYKNISFTVWDIGGQKTIRSLWYHYFPNTSAVIFVVDSSDVARIETAKEELHEILQHDDLRNSVLLVLANKQDMPHALSVNELAKQLELSNLKQTWHIQGTSATKGEGVYEGLDHLRGMLQRKGNK